MIYYIVIIIFSNFIEVQFDLIISLITYSTKINYLR